MEESTHITLQYIKQIFRRKQFVLDIGGTPTLVLTIFDI